MHCLPYIAQLNYYPLGMLFYLLFYGSSTAYGYIACMQLKQKTKNMFIERYFCYNIENRHKIKIGEMK